MKKRIILLLTVLKADFYAVTELDDGEIVFEDGQTDAGIPLLIARAADGSFGAVYTIYMSHEIEVDVFPGGGKEAVSDEDVNTVLAFLNSVEFAPLENK